jgi:hypothetical protein
MKLFLLPLFFTSAASARVPMKEEALQGEEVAFWDRLLHKGYDNNSIRYPPPPPPSPAYYPVPAPTPVKYPTPAPTAPAYYPVAAPTPTPPTSNCSPTQIWSPGFRAGIQEYIVNLGQTQGFFEGFYEFDTRVAQIDIFYEYDKNNPKPIYSAGVNPARGFSGNDNVKGRHNFNATYGSATYKSTNITLMIQVADVNSRNWTVVVGCPK